MNEKEFIIKDFSEGLIDKIDDNLLPENAAKDVQNWIGRYVGSLTKRNGQVRLNSTPLGGPISGLYPYYVGSTRRIIVSANGVVAYWTGSAFVDLKTALNTTAPYFFETCINYMVAFNGVDAPWKWDGTTVSALANAPTDGQFPVLHKEKLFVVPKSTPSTLKWSDSFAPETWQGVNYWDVKKGDGDSITNLKKFLGELVIFKRRSIHSLRGTSLDDFRLDENVTQIGCVGPNAATLSTLYVYFVSDEGLMAYNGLKVINISQDRIPKLWANINKQYIDKAAVGIWGKFIWFALPEGSSTYNNMVILYDPPADGAAGGKFWSLRGINASCFMRYSDGTQELFYAGDSNAGYVNQQDVGSDDFGSVINAYWVGKVFDMGSPERDKRAKRVFVKDSPTTTNVVDLQISMDYGAFSSLNLRGTDRYVREFRFSSANTRWRYLAPKLIHNALGPCEVRGILMPYKARTRPKVRVV